MSKPITQADYDYIAAHQAESSMTIGRAIGRSDNAVLRQLRRIRAGLPFQPVRQARRLSDAIEAQIRCLRDQGHSIPCIAHTVDASGNAVRRVVGSSQSYVTCGCLKAMGIASVKTHRRHTSYAAPVVVQQIARIGELNQQGKPIRVIVAETGLTHTVVERRLERFYAQNPDKKRPDLSRNMTFVEQSRIDRMVEMLKAGHSQPQVQAALSLSRNVLERLVKEAKRRGELPPVLSSSPLLARRNAVKTAVPVATTTPLWTEGRDRYLRVGFKMKTPRDVLLEELNDEFPHLARLTHEALTLRLYGTAA
jgi:hypothetical protein